MWRKNSTSFFILAHANNKNKLMKLKEIKKMHNDGELFVCNNCQQTIMSICQFNMTDFSCNNFSKHQSSCQCRNRLFLSWCEFSLFVDHFAS